MFCSSFDKPIKVGKRSKVVMSHRIIVDMAADEAFALYVAFCRGNSEKAMTILKQFAVSYEKLCFENYSECNGLV